MSGLPERFAGPLSYARNFSELMHGAALLYNLMLSELTDREEKAAEYRAKMADWAKTLENRRGDLEAWDWSAFWNLVLGLNPWITKRTQRFIEGWRNFAIGGDPRKIDRAENARRLIREREQQLKGKLARFDNARAREVWGGRSGSAQLDFRWGITRDLLTDIFDGLDRADA